MKSALKILKLIVILILTVSIILFTASLLLQDKVAEIVLKSLNRNLSTKLDVGSVSLSFLRRFPKASLELKDVLVHSSPSFVKSKFPGINTDTLFAAKTVSVEFKITDIINGNYTIESIRAKEGKLNIFTDPSGFVNYDISFNKETTENVEFTIALEKINLSEIKGYYNNLATKLILLGVVREGSIKSRISGDNIDFKSEAELEINRFQLFDTKITKTLAADLALTLQKSKNGIQFTSGSIVIEEDSFGMDGFMSAENMLDLNITGQSINLAKIRKYLPEKYSTLAAEYKPSGIMVVNCKINGPLTRTKNPHVEIKTTLSNGQLTFVKSDITLNNLSFSGNFSNGTENNYKTSSVSIKDLKARLGSSDYTGSVIVTGFTHPVTTLALKGRAFPGELKEFFDIKKISAAEGSVDVDLKLITDYWPKDSITLNDLLGLKPKANLVFNTFSLGLESDKILVNDVTGNISVSEVIIAENLRFLYKKQNILVDGEFRNLPEWLAGKPVKLIASADVSFDRFIPEALMNGTSSSEKNSSGKTAFSFPGDLILDINFKADSLIYKTFKASKIDGNLSYKPRTLTFKSLNMNTLNGAISGNGFIVQNVSKSLIARGSFDVSDIDVNKAFNTFRNFGQSFLKAENLAGTLSGTLSVLLPLDSLLNPQIKTITAEGKYVISEGALINFDPIKQLSNFIELSELENISFEKFENDFFIRNNFLYVPQMDIKSSAADLSISGKHSFDNDYQYHIKMLLSEILSKKRKKNKSNLTEFGAVQDDGLGRTSILLKIDGKGEDIKVGYDIKAAGSEVKNNIKSERQTLKSILNQEYGWYKSDTTAKEKPAEKKPRFKISWEEGETTKNVADTSSVKKETTIKNLFKKK